MKGRRTLFFSFEVSGEQHETCWDTLLTLEPEDGILGEVELLQKAALPRLSAVPGRERNIKVHNVTSKFRLA